MANNEYTEHVKRELKDTYRALDMARLERALTVKILEREKKALARQIRVLKDRLKKVRARSAKRDMQFYGLRETNKKLRYRLRSVKLVASNGNGRTKMQALPDDSLDA